MPNRPYIERLDENEKKIKRGWGRGGVIVTS